MAFAICTSVRFLQMRLFLCRSFSWTGPGLEAWHTSQQVIYKACWQAYTLSLNGAQTSTSLAGASSRAEHAAGEDEYQVI